MMSSVEEPRENPLQHILVIWVALLVGLIGAFALTVLALNATVYSAGGFVTSYLQALERHDLNGALATPGVLRVPGVSTKLLVPNALGPIDDFSITSDLDQGGGVHQVAYQASLGGLPASGTFQILKGENRFGVFSTWSFLQSPMSILRATPMHDASFTANGIELTSPNGPSVAADFQVLTPGIFTLTHTSAYLTATPMKTPITRPGSTVAAVLDIQALPSFVDAIQKQMDDFLNKCATQKVLFPTGCPFGQGISNYVESVPMWSMSTYPKVTIEPGNNPGTWIVPEAKAAAHLTVDVRSLFDGTISKFDEDVPFGVSWVMTIKDDRITIQQ